MSWTSQPPGWLPADSDEINPNSVARRKHDASTTTETGLPRSTHRPELHFVYHQLGARARLREQTWMVHGEVTPAECQLVPQQEAKYPPSVVPARRQTRKAEQSAGGFEVNEVPQFRGCSEHESFVPRPEVRRA